MINKKIDILEIILKEDLEITLEPDEKQQLENIDQEFKNELISLVNNENYLDEIEKIANTIIKKSSLLPKEQQDYIKTKCLERINKLKYPNLLSDCCNSSCINKK